MNAKQDLLQQKLTKVIMGRGYDSAPSIGEAAKKARELIAEGADPSLRSVEINPGSSQEKKTNLIILAACHGATAILRALLEAPAAQFNIVDDDGDNALIASLNRGHQQCAQLLLRKTNLATVNKQGASALTASLECEDINIFFEIASMIDPDQLPLEMLRVEQCRQRHSETLIDQALQFLSDRIVREIGTACAPNQCSKAPAPRL